MVTAARARVAHRKDIDSNMFLQAAAAAAVAHDRCVYTYAYVLHLSCRCVCVCVSIERWNSILTI